MKARRKIQKTVEKDKNSHQGEYFNHRKIPQNSMTQGGL